MRRRPHVVLAALAAQASLSLASTSDVRAQQPETLRVMTFNIWVGGESGGQPLDQTAQVVRQAQADIIGLQEVRGRERDGKRPDNGEKVARLLSMNYFSQGDDGTAVMTRYKIVGHTPRKWGVEIELPTGRRVWLFNVHFSASPYQPYQLLSIPYNDTPFLKTADEAVAAARDTRGAQVASMLAELKAVGDGATVFITGDFNEPSPLDWTEASRAAGHSPLTVPWPTVSAVYDAGFVDAYRHAHPDPVASPGNTWTPITAADDPNDRHDRIDFVLVSNGRGMVEQAEVVGEDEQHADIVVVPYPSDHRAVVATIKLQ